MFCTRCGIETGELDRFCAQCGNVTPGSSASAAVYPVAGNAVQPLGGSQLTRSLRNRKIAGVCGGIGRYFGVDPTIVRILFVVMFFCPVLPAIIPYIVCCFVMPLERPEPVASAAYPMSGQPLPTMAR